MKSLVILISGRGSNMIRIAQCCQEQAWPAKVACVISNRADAHGLSSAQQMGLRTEVVAHGDFDSRESFDLALADRIEHYQADIVVLAGFMRILTAGFVSRFSNRLINIHPSLLPAFTGLNTHARALAAGVKLHGATVHFVTAELDAGPIIAQAAVPVSGKDTAASLQARVQRAEHQLYPAALQWLVGDQLTIEGAITRRDGPAHFFIDDRDMNASSGNFVG